MPKNTNSGSYNEAARDLDAEAGPPAKSAPKAEWVDHAVAQGVPPDEAEAKTKAELIEDHGEA